MKIEMDFYENFFDTAESQRFFTVLKHEIEWRQKTIKIFGKDILEPRLTAWHGSPEAVYTYSGTKLTPAPWTAALVEIRKKIEPVCKCEFNSVLLNLYRDHRDSMGLHSDDEKELGQNPVIASVSFGATRKFILKSRGVEKKSHSYNLADGSLLIMRGSLQKLWKHGIPKDTEPCGPRINLTFRKIIAQP